MTYVISDIHGYYDLLIKLLKKVNFTMNDNLICLGDMIDKGPNSIKVLNLLFTLPNCKCILGNHEYDFLKYYNNIMQETSDDTDYNIILKKLQGYFPEDGYLLTWDMINRLEELPCYLEYDNYIVCHAGVPIDSNHNMKDLRKCYIEDFVYDRFFKDRNFPVGNKCIIFGHTPVRYITNEDKFIFYKRSNYVNCVNINDYYKIHIDTGVYLSNTLGILCIDNCKAYYVDLNG